MQTAYSYVRFSTPEQKSGDSTRRQVELSERWCLRNGYTLDRTLVPVEEGRSASKGDHLKGSGKLALFLRFVEGGVIKPGSALIVESLDRVSRQNIESAMAVARKILMAGVDIVTTVPEYRYTKAGLQNSVVDWILLTTHFQRAFEESRLKGERTKANWSEARKRIAAGQVVTANKPFWLDLVQDGNVVPPGRAKVDLDRPIEFRENDKAAIVRHIFQMADTGNGVSLIGADLIRRGWKFRQTMPTGCTIARVLRSRTVLGEYQSRLARDADRVRKVAGEVVEGYYPRIISDEQFARVQAAISDRFKKRRGRKGGSGGTIFRGMLVDARDGGPIHTKMTRGRRWMANGWAIRGKPGSVWIDFPYDVFESGILRACRELPPAFLSAETPAAERVNRLEGELAVMVAKVEKASARLADATDDAEEEVWSARVVGLVRRRKEIEVGLEAARVEMSDTPADQLARLQSVSETLAGADAVEGVRLRALLSGLLVSVCKRVVVYFQKRGRTRRESKRCWAWMEFHNGKRRKLLIDGTSGVVVTMLDDDGPDYLVTDENGWDKVTGKANMPRESSALNGLLPIE